MDPKQTDIEDLILFLEGKTRKEITFSYRIQKEKIN
jgi:hypothetical protein